MTWTLAWTDNAFREMAKLETPIAKRIRDKLRSTLEDPSRFLTRLVGEDGWRLRVGDYRVICLLSFDAETVIVQKVGHRSTVYGGEA